jgi:hypothetical protein
MDEIEKAYQNLAQVLYEKSESILDGGVPWSELSGLDRMYWNLLAERALREREEIEAFYRACDSKMPATTA